ncbi:Mce-associated membrane protein [Mycolicibacterium iranicum]|uniref:Mce-associated membrane protein n=1 Tax=Mycolicibacterium iranicum TaxID=912594 RepID=A0A839Q3S0_MYCIR|nr:RDD family protein [Mycolicibacterium iranicum]MBB2988886.1 Mce-associated membrane protein [Mycolicibacterium iranicum]
MTAVLDTTTTPEDTVPEVARAPWLRRAGALAVDTLPALAVMATMAILAFSTPADAWPRWVFAALFALTFVAMVVNRLVLPTVTGWTLGRALTGIAVRRPDGAAVGILRLTLRDVAHLLDTAALFIGWLWPLWDRRRRTFADMLARTEVVRADPPRRDMRSLVAKVLIAAAVLSVAGVGLAYAVVYRQERAVDTARQQVAEQGPRIVEQMLSYGADTMADDFARAQSLTTKGYRAQLIAQQQAVLNAGAATNEYWAVNSVVLTDPPVTHDRASMLLAMQGQRGSKPEDQKFITATVRVDFEKSSGGQWQVANLTVLKKPAMSQGGQ